MVKFVLNQRQQTLPTIIHINRFAWNEKIL